MIKISPDDGNLNLGIKSIKVDFPLPERPTIALIVDLLIVKLTPFNVSLSFRLYLYLTSSNTIDSISNKSSIYFQNFY